MIHGIDVSAYQSATYSTSGLDFVFTKVTEGLTYTNPRWAQQRDRAKAAGLVWGAYHYPHMANDPRAEAAYFLQQVNWKPGDIIVLDWEGYDAYNKGVPKSRQVAYRDAWLKYVKSVMPGHRVGMYANTDYWLHVDTTGNCGDFLWIATAGAAAGQPGIKAKWTFHQYSTAGGIDHDVAAFPTRAALAEWAASTTPEEDDMPTASDVWKADVIPAAAPPYNNSDFDKNKFWEASYALSTAVLTGRKTEAKVDALAEVVAGIKTKVDSLSVGGVDLDALAVNVADLLATRLKD
ncbi:glycoside hydrolase family 25 protein [Streptomyces sp. NPDC047028]|uniref:glycoside hydrolase family 25 protein n=1 Tax=Streptomyces sp. NPDC047028 TaxID=3155793 RepID=UPI003409502B